MKALFLRRLMRRFDLLPGFKTYLAGFTALLMLVCKQAGIDLPYDIQDTEGLVEGLAALAGVFAKLGQDRPKWEGAPDAE